MTEFIDSRCRWSSDVTVLELVGEGVELLCLPDEEVIIRLITNFRSVLNITVENVITTQRCTM
jgi:hypothetical protein